MSDIFGFEGKLVSSEFKRLLSLISGDTANFKNYSSWSNWSSVHFETSFSSSHWNFQRFFGVGFVWKYTYPNSSSLFEVTNDGSTCRFDLSRSYITRLGDFECKIPESDIRTSNRESSDDSTLRFSIFRFLRLKHGVAEL